MAEIHVHRSAIRDEAGAAGGFGRSMVLCRVVAKVQADRGAPLALSSAIRFQRGTGACDTGALRHSLSDDDVEGILERCGYLVVLHMVGI